MFVIEFTSTLYRINTICQMIYCNDVSQLQYTILYQYYTYHTAGLNEYMYMAIIFRQSSLKTIAVAMGFNNDKVMFVYRPRMN